METLDVTRNSLQDLAGKEAGSVHLVAKDCDAQGIEAVVSACLSHGKAVGALTLSRARYDTHDLTELDVVACLPHVRTLNLGRLRLNGSVLNHPEVEHVQLEACWLLTSEPFVAQAPRLKTLSLQEVNWGDLEEACLGQCTFGLNAALESFKYSLDEDNAELCPEVLVFDGCPHLREIYLHVTGTWKLALRGDLAAFEKLTASSQRYGSHSLDFQGIGAGSSPFARSLQEGRGPCHGQHYCFLGEIEDLNKIIPLIKALGGQVSTQLNPAVTCLVLDETEYAAYEDGEPSPQVAEAVLREQEGTLEIYDIDYFTTDLFYAWY